MQIQYLSWRFSYASIQGRHLSVCIKQVIATLLWTTQLPLAITKQLLHSQPYIPISQIPRFRHSPNTYSITMQLLISSIQFKFISLNKQSIKETRALIAVVLYWYFLHLQTSKSMLQQQSYIFFLFFQLHCNCAHLQKDVHYS